MAAEPAVWDEDGSGSGFLAFDFAPDAVSDGVAMEQPTVTINRRAAERVKTLRGVGGDIVAQGVPQEEGIERVFALNMGIYKIKFSMNLAMNFLYHAAVATALGVGGLLVVEHRLQLGTVVAVVSGLGKLNDPWGDLVNWFREFSVDSVKYRLFADALEHHTGAGRGLATA